MKYYSLASLSLCLVTATLVAADAPAFKDQKDKVSYGIGLNIGRNLKSQDVPVNPDALLAGIKDAMSGAKPQVSDEDIKAAMMNAQKEITAKQNEKAAAAGSKNQKEGADFLAANKKKDGVVTLPSGLQYKVITTGKGAKPAATATVKTHYRGTLIDGTEFDSSYKRGEPAVFPINGVIKGWTEALQLMPVGSKWQLFIPSDLAYGERGAGELIGPNATLVFEVELLSIEP